MFPQQLFNVLPPMEMATCNSPLLYAAGNGHEAVVKIFVMCDDIEVNTKDQDGCLPLSYVNEWGVRRQ